MTPWSAGTQLGPYELLAPLGAGGMGEVWKARDTRLNRTVAIKRLKTAHSARFEQEARAIAALNHPHICQIHDIGPDYLVLEFIDGSPLKGPLPATEALGVARDIAAALEAAHVKGILHRDLKPANVLVTAGGAKLLDFGLAKLVHDSDATQTMGIAGTLVYMSPEQAEGKPLDPCSDIFSFGAVLYELLAGRRAFDSLAAVLRDDPAPLDSPLFAIVKRCLAKNPADRFPSATELRTACEAVRLTAPASAPSIAVLPFANLSLDKEQEFFSDGLAEEIINALAQMPGLKVTARTSAFAFRGKEQDIRKIAEALDVRTILEGSVRRAGNRIRVTAQLINAADGYHLWSQRYDRELVDVFEVQDEMAAAISAALQLKLAPKPAAAERYKPNLEAYEAYLKGRHLVVRATPEDMGRAKGYFEQAIALDPKFALAYYELGSSLIMLAVVGFRPPQDVLPQGRAWVQKALDLDPTLPEAHAMLAISAATWDYNWSEAERLFSRALARDPVPAQARMLYTVHLVSLGRASEGVEQMRRAVEEDPLFLFYRFYLALCLMIAGRYDETEREAWHMLELSPDAQQANGIMSILHVSRRQFDRALPFAEKSNALAPRVPQIISTLAGLCARTGDAGRASELLRKLGPPETYAVPRALAMFHAIQGETEQAADWWDKAIDQRDPAIPFMSQLPLFKPLRESARWPALAKRMNLPIL